MVFVSQCCYKSGPLRTIRQLNHDSCKVCHQSLVTFDPSFVSQIGRFEVRLLLVKIKSVC